MGVGVTGHLSIKFRGRGTTTSLPLCELFPGSWGKVRTLTLGVWILFPGGPGGGLSVPRRCLSLGCGVFLGDLRQLCGDTWLGSDLSPGGGLFGAAYLRHVGEEAVLGGVLSSVRDSPCVMVSAPVGGRVFG